MTPVTVTNLNKEGKETPGQWHVRVGRRWRTFTQDQWVSGGISYINDMLRKNA